MAATVAGSIPLEMANKLVALAKREGRSVSSLVTEAVKKYIAEGEQAENSAKTAGVTQEQAGS